MGVRLITGYAGVGHITAADAGKFNAGIFGEGRYVLNTGYKLAYVLESNNLIKIKSGDIVMQGRHISIPENTMESLSIENGSQNKSRIDLIVMKYTKNTSTGVESASLIVKKGTESTGTPQAPSVTSGNIFNGDAVDEFPLYEVRLDGLQVSSVKALFELAPTMASILDITYPVGSIYITVSDVNPGTLFGGTWQALKDRFLIGAGGSYTINATGGAATKALSTNEMPAHTHVVPSHSHTASAASAGAHSHTVARNKNAGSGTGRYAAQANSSTNTTHSTSSNGAHTHTITVNAAAAMSTESAGSGAAFSIMPPYLAVFMWKRTA